MTLADLANQAVGNMFDSLDHLAELYGEEITDNIELVRALRAQVDYHKTAARELQEKLDEANELVADLSDSNMDLRSMLATARRAA